jgi:MFS family permease
MRFVASTPLVASLLLLTGLFSLFGRSYTTLLPAFARQVLRLDERSLGFMYSAPGLGTIVGGFVLAWVGDVRRKGSLLLAGAVVSSGLLMGFSISPSLALCLILLAGIGAASTIYSATATTLLQVNAPGAMRGRVMSYNTVVLLGLTPFGGSLTGFAAEFVGVREAILAGAAAVAVVTVAIYLLSPHIREQDRLDYAPLSPGGSSS